MFNAWKLTVFLELRSRRTARFSELIMSADKYLSIFSSQMEATDYTTIKVDRKQQPVGELFKHNALTGIITDKFLF